MQTHNLKRPKGIISPKKRVGRGGKRGTYSGKGGKGQTARAGRKIQSQLKEQLLRTPKKRGEGNIVIKKKIFEIQFRDIVNKCPNNSEISEKILRQQELLPKRAKNFKIIGSVKDLKKKYIVKNVTLSKGVKQSIEEAGGSFVLKEDKPSV